MRWLFLCGLLGMASASHAESIVAARTLPARTLIAPTDVLVSPDTWAGTATNLDDVIGKETRTAIYAGRPLHLSALGAPAVIERNQLTTVVYNAGGLRIATEGRAMERGAVGAVIRVMNLSSRTIVQGTVQPDASISTYGVE